MSKLPYLMALSAALTTLTVGLSSQAQPPEQQAVQIPLRGQYISRSTFANPHPHIPPQCYIETSYGTQNTCQSCHTNGVFNLKLGNNNPQAGANPNIGNLQEEYAFGVYDYPQTINSSINPWRNVIHPEELRQIVKNLGEHPEGWNMSDYVRQDNWQAAYNQRKGRNAWDSGQDSPFRLFPALSPADLPAQNDGFVRSNSPERALFNDDKGHNTGWRAINFMPYGIFTPLTGSVSGVYIRLSTPFMKNAAGQYDLAAYEGNLDLVQRNIQDRLRGETHYLGAAAGVAIVRGQYPLGTELAHPLHYTDPLADGKHPAASPFGGMRARRVKEIRWMYKRSEWHPDEFGLALKEESAPIYANREQGWIDNGAGWLLAGWIEDKAGALRPQTPSELTQCAGCHSGNVRQSDVGQNAVFTSGTGNTIDSTWAMPRQFTGPLGWQEMNYLGYSYAKPARPQDPVGRLSTPEPLNRGKNVGEYRYFLEHVVGASLYGDMPAGVDRFLDEHIRKQRGYSADWPSLSEVLQKRDAAGIQAAQKLRQRLMRELTARGEYLDGATLQAALFLPSEAETEQKARLYRQVVVSQRYDFGKDVFAEVPFTLRYFRMPKDAFTHQNGQPYGLGELITDRPINTAPADLTYGVGNASTLIDEADQVTDYAPLLK